MGGAPEKDYEQTIETLKSQLVELQLDYVDLYLIHAPLSELRLEQWRGLIELKHLGLAKNIGVSNYDQMQIEEIIRAGMVKPDANQIEFHPICANHKLSAYMKEMSIEPIAYSSLAPLSSWRKEEGGQGGEVLADIKEECQRIVHEIAVELKVSDAQVLLRWGGMQQGYSVLTKSSKSERIRENLDLYSFELSTDNMRRLDQLNQNQAIAWAASGINPMTTAPTLV